MVYSLSLDLLLHITVSSTIAIDLFVVSSVSMCSIC